MSYTSRELTHFVGAGLKRDRQKQFDLLVTILESGILSPRPDNPSSWYNRFYGEHLTLKWGEMYPHFCCACFCDIPLVDVDLHIRKYSEFGLAFLKSFMVTKGATPMFYVAANAPYIFSEERLADRFVEMANKFQDFSGLIAGMPGRPEGWAGAALHDLETA
jgi:hypothetical protein